MILFWSTSKQVRWIAAFPIVTRVACKQASNLTFRDNQRNAMRPMLKSADKRFSISIISEPELPFPALVMISNIDSRPKSRNQFFWKTLQQMIVFSHSITLEKRGAPTAMTVPGSVGAPRQSLVTEPRQRSFLFEALLTGPDRVCSLVSVTTPTTTTSLLPNRLFTPLAHQRNRLLESRSANQLN
jgi:hypothetical protein